MPLISAVNLTHAYGNQLVLDGVSFSIEPGEKAGLVGRNGTGKTTLMKILLGERRPDQGEVQVQRGARIGYLSQDPQFDPQESLRDAAEAAFAELHELHRTLHEVCDAMATAQGEELERLLKRHERLEAQVQAAGGYAIDHKIDATLHGLGFTDDQFGISTRGLSGGQKNRLGLARLLLEAPDLLLLDEPTNHLDIAGRQWLEEFLSEEYSGAVLLVSHDRWLLDRVVDRILEMDQGAMHDHPGSYQAYVESRQQRRLTQARVHEKQLDHVRREKQFIQRYKAGQRAKQARGRQSRLERFRAEMVERPVEMDVMRLNLPPAARSGDQVLMAEGISKSYGDLTLFRDFDLVIGRGERIGIIGPNGVGKTTLVRVLLGELAPDAGKVRLGSRLSVGHYRQLHDHLDLSLAVWEYLQSVIAPYGGGVRASEQQARDLAGAFLFSGQEQDKHLSQLSGGERSRAVLAGLVAGAHNLLVLDEPSNHLDIQSAERLEAALSPEGGYEGTLILISHDRALLQATCQRLIVFEGGGVVRLFEGRLLDWMERAAAPPPAAEPAPAPPKRSKPAAAAAPASPRPAAKPAKKGSLAGVATAELERKIEAVESELSEVDRRLLDPAVLRDGARSRDLKRRREELRAALEPLEAEWSRRAE
jgi:ATP-binding cassette subfamily F protein 3